MAHMASDFFIFFFYLNESVCCPMELGAAIIQKDRSELDSCCVNVDIDPVSITNCERRSG